MVPTFAEEGGEAPLRGKFFRVFEFVKQNKPQKGDETMMNYLNSLYVQLMTSINSLKSEKGQGLVEYALILVLIAIVVIATLTVLGNKTNNVFSNIGSAIN
jgi:pilus assembly protein Flp/PilA